MNQLGIRVLSCLVLLLSLCISGVRGDELATLTGYVTDSSGLHVAGAKVQATNVETNISYYGESNSEGLFRIGALPTGSYRVVVQKTGFKTTVKQGLELHVQDIVSLNFQLEVGSIAESVTVKAETPLVNTESASVSTVIERNFVESLPLNGRSFQSLIQLTPGVVIAAGNGQDGGQFNINGQRADANYWTVDGASANIGIGSNFGGNGVAGGLPSFSVLGGTNSLVSVDALQEFRIQTSTYAPEFGRVPGGQVSIVTRSGANKVHGTLFDYLRNDALDANGWFADAEKLAKPQERQNDFGGTFSGPILKDRTFFFFSYEGLRLRLPHTALTTVPCNSSCLISGDARANAQPGMQPFLNAFPLPNGADNGDGTAVFNKSYSDPASLDASSLRMDHKVNDRLNLFARYNYSPSNISQRGLAGAALSSTNHAKVVTQTATFGSTWSLSPRMVDDFRFNFSRTNSNSFNALDNFGGAVPLSSLPFPSAFTGGNSGLGLFIFSLKNSNDSNNPSGLSAGKVFRNVQRQLNFVDTAQFQKGSHGFKFGVDYRRLTPSVDPILYGQSVDFFDVASAAAGCSFFGTVSAGRPSQLLFQNLGVFAQDTWQALPRLSVTYGLRWDVDFVPSSSSGPSLSSVTGFNLNGLSNLALAPAGTPPYKTTYGNVAPRIGVAYQVSRNRDRAMVLRGGFGVFYDLASTETGNVMSGNYPFFAQVPFFGSYPLDPSTTGAAPAFTTANGLLAAFDPGLKLPYTLQWNAALEQGLGSQQTLSASYIGAQGRRLIQTGFLSPVNSTADPTIVAAVLEANSATSDYHALQLQFQRRMFQGLQMLTSYTLSHSIDSASAGYIGVTEFSNGIVPGLGPNTNRGPSTFDIRHSFTSGLTYEIPKPKVNPFLGSVLHGWSLQSMIQARSAPPVNISSNFLYGFFVGNSNGLTAVRPDLVPGVPLYLHGSQYPGGKAINPSAFTAPPFTPAGCNPGPPTFDFPCNAARQGTLGRNALRGFGATQWDFGFRREFHIYGAESWRLQFRAEMFNILNHPNFGPPVADPGLPNFGRATQILSESLGANLGSGGFDSLYQLGGPRSIQLALKLVF